MYIKIGASSVRLSLVFTYWQRSPTWREIWRKREEEGKGEIEWVGEDRADWREESRDGEGS